VTADLTPAGPYRSGERVLLVVDVTNLGGRGAPVLTLVNQASNLETEPLWGGCEAAPCPPFALAALTQKQITIPATVIDAGRPIVDVVTVSDGAVQHSAEVRVRPPKRPDLLLFVILGGALLAVGGAAALARTSKTAQRRRWGARIAAQGALAATEETSVGDVKFTAPPIGVTARLDPGETRFAAPIPIGSPGRPF
jgi:hypothetical protein